MKSIQGYEPRKNITFTPSSQAHWTDHFNKLLVSLNEQGFNVSRNLLTERLIEEGLKTYSPLGDSKILNIECTEYTSEQLELLRSPQCQQVIKNFLNMMLGIGGTLSVETNSVPLQVQKEVSVTAPSPTWSVPDERIAHNEDNSSLEIAVNLQPKKQEEGPANPLQRLNKLRRAQTPDL
jgi:hypothetical protein